MSVLAIDYPNIFENVPAARPGGNIFVVRLGCGKETDKNFFQGSFVVSTINE